MHIHILSIVLTIFPILYGFILMPSRNPRTPRRVICCIRGTSLSLFINGMQVIYRGILGPKYCLFSRLISSIG